MSVKTILWVNGVLTAIDVAFPQLVGFGMFLLILPGVILALAPTVFIYTATFAIARRYLPITRAVALNLTAVFITLGLGVLATLPFAVAGWLAFNQAAIGDVAPQDRVVIGGDVLLNNEEAPGEYIAEDLGLPVHPLIIVYAGRRDHVLERGVACFLVDPLDALWREDGEAGRRP